jgi:hypothetical protein
MSDNGVSTTYVDNKIARLDGQITRLDGQITSLRSEMNAQNKKLNQKIESEIEKLEKQMKEIGEMVVRAINLQTTALVGGVAATTAMIESTKHQIETDFDKTREKIDVQTESVLQIEVGKKIADASALKAKLEAFLGDIKSRFDKSIAGVAINRELYNLNFHKITDEYESKIRKIGEHIFQVRFEDVAPAMKAAEILYEDAHSLPMEMDLSRLSARAKNLDEMLEILKANRLDDVMAWLETLGSKLDLYSSGDQLPGKNVELGVEAIAVLSPGSTSIIAGMQAQSVSPGSGIDLSPVNDSLQVFSTDRARELLSAVLEHARFRGLDGKEIVALSNASSALRERNMISAEAKGMFDDFLGSGNLKVLEV